jgi:transcriptional regulator with XRE-family HTH domain
MEHAMYAETGFGPRLRELREQAGLTLAKLSEMAGMHLQSLAKLESGQREPNWTTVLALGKALGVTCEAFTVKPKAAKPARKRGKK